MGPVAEMARKLNDTSKVTSSKQINYFCFKPHTAFSLLTLPARTDTCCTEKTVSVIFLRLASIISTQNGCKCFTTFEVTKSSTQHCKWSLSNMGDSVYTQYNNTDFLTSFGPICLEPFLLKNGCEC